MSYYNDNGPDWLGGIVFLIILVLLLVLTSGCTTVKTQDAVKLCLSNTVRVYVEHNEKGRLEVQCK